jgi:hypothetical protein
LSNWRDFLTNAERERIAKIPDERDKLTAEYKAIYNRARTRMYRAKVQ